MLAKTGTIDLLCAIAVTLIGGVLAWTLAGSLPLIGIDDAAITRSYAENIANGHGYVYNIGGERVEGATALLWVILLTIAYSIASSPEALIVGLCWLLTLWAVFSTIRLTRVLSVALDAPSATAIWVLCVIFVAMPGYFLWSVWTMMELALWSAMLIQLVLGLVILGRGENSKTLAKLAVIVPAALLPMIRPEGIAVAVGLALLAALVSPTCRRTGVTAIIASFAVFAVITGFRLVYFGVPWPNTFYAKVSSDALQGLKDGLKYLATFLLDAPFMAVFVVLWLGAVIWALLRISANRPLSAAVLVPAAAVFGILFTYAGLGGDHFVLWRFYQPATPLLYVAPALLIAIVAPRLSDWAALSVAGNRMLVTGLVVGFFGMSWLHYYQARFDVMKEFTLVEQGIAFGEELNSFDPKPVTGIGPAGGMALAYQGPLRDLLGLNWAEMARANPIKIGMRNHASFDEGVFWAHPPDLVAEFQRGCDDVWPTLGNTLNGLYREPRFQSAYKPIFVRRGAACWPAFARNEWLAEVDDPRISQVGWDQVRFRE